MSGHVSWRLPLDLAPNGPSAKKVRSDFSHFLQGPPDRLFRQSVRNPSKTITFRGKVLFYLAPRGCTALAVNICPGPSKPSCFIAFSLQDAHKPKLSRLEPPWGRFGRHFGVPRCYFSRFVSEKCVVAISMPLCSGIATFEGLGAQVGATWA